MYHMKEWNKENMIPYMESLRESNKDIVKPFAEKFGVDFIKGKKPWEVPCDIAIPSAIQNEINEKDAEMLLIMIVSLLQKHCQYAMHRTSNKII